MPQVLLQPELTDFVDSRPSCWCESRQAQQASWAEGAMQAVQCNYLTVVQPPWAIQQSSTAVALGGWQVPSWLLQVSVAQRSTVLMRKHACWRCVCRPQAVTELSRVSEGPLVSPDS